LGYYDTIDGQAALQKIYEQQQQDRQAGKYIWRPVYMRVCPVCNSLFFTKNKYQKYCTLEEILTRSADGTEVIKKRWPNCAPKANSQRQAQKRKMANAQHIAYCKQCGQAFIGRRTDTKYCSSKCRQKAYRVNKSVTDNIQATDGTMQYV